MIRAYKYRIYPTRAQVTKLEHVLDICCELYNSALQERRDAWRVARKSVSCYDQQKQLTEIKKIRPELSDVYSQVLYDTLVRLDKAFAAFFRRVRAGERAAGFPRFRSRSRYSSFTFPQYPHFGFSIVSGKLKLSKIGMIKIKLHRPIEGKIKTLTVTRSSTNKWFACFSVETEPQPLPKTTSAVGINMGLKSFATLSTGEMIDNPKFFRSEEKRLARAQKKLSATKKGSQERRKQRKTVARVHERIANKRRNFAHQESRKLVDRFGIIVFEKLNIRGMLKNHCLAKSISDAAWNQTIQFTAYKAESAGRFEVRVNPRNTSNTTFCCGEHVDITLADRVIHCPKCHSITDRDWNASLNILALGLQSIGHRTIEAASFEGAE
jgi:putative transposase